LFSRKNRPVEASQRTLPDPPDEFTRSWKA